MGIQDNGERLPGEAANVPGPGQAPPDTDERPSEADIRFRVLPGIFAYKYKSFDADGDTFTGFYKAHHEPGETPEGGEEPLKYEGLEFEDFATRERVIVPGNFQLVKKFVHEIALDPARIGNVFRITRVRKLALDGGKSVLEFRIEEGEYPLKARTA